MSKCDCGDQRHKQVTVIRCDLKRVVDYLWADEEKHYAESNKPKSHIFRTLRILKEDLEQEVV